MHAEEVQAIIQSQLPEARVITAGEGCDFQVTVISEQFAGLTPVKKQQLVYQCLNQYIASGAIHALTIKAHTPQQWQALQD